MPAETHLDLEATARLSAERLQLSGILSEIPLAIMAVGPDRSVMLYDRQTVDILGSVAPLGLGRPVTDYLSGPSLGHAMQALAAGPAYVDAELDTADGRRRVKARLRPLGRDGGILLANCPFHRLARRHTETVCHLNLELLTGAAETTGRDRVVVLDPSPGRCCVRAVPAAS